VWQVFDDGTGSAGRACQLVDPAGGSMHLGRFSRHATTPQVRLNMLMALLLSWCWAMLCC
jgi:CxxC motif-containing protein (DUF1111 family)